MKDSRPAIALALALMTRIVTAGPSVEKATPAASVLLQPANFIPAGSFRLPQNKLGSTWGFGSHTGCCGLGAYAVTFNPEHNSLYIGGHPYEQRLAEIAIPASLAGYPIATALSPLVDPVEGRIGSINPADPNQKVLSSALVYDGRLYLGAFAYYDGAVTQTKSMFARPTSLATTGQVVGPVRLGNTYPGWVDRVASLVPPEWQAALGGPAFAGGGGGAINSAQSWGPSLSVYDPARIGSADSVPATVVLGYPMGHPLADTSVGNALWSPVDVVAAVVAVPGTSSVLFFGKHGMGKYCYGPGADCGDKDDDSKGAHAYPYRSQVWAYDINDLVLVKNGRKKNYEVKPYATWEFDSSFKEIQGAAYDPATKRLFVSEVSGDNETAQPLILVYTVQ